MFSPRLLSMRQNRAAACSIVTLGFKPGDNLKLSETLLPFILLPQNVKPGNQC